MKLFVAYTESEHYAGGGEYFLAEADTIWEAEDRIMEAANSYWYEQDQSQLEEEELWDELQSGSYASVMWVQELTPEHEMWPHRSEFTRC
jgi:hypothetical protein